MKENYQNYLPHQFIKKPTPTVIVSHLYTCSSRFFIIATLIGIWISFDRERYNAFSLVRLQQAYLKDRKAPKSLIDRVTNVNEVYFVTGEMDLHVNLIY